MGEEIREVDGDVAILRLRGEFTLEDAVQRARESILRIKGSGIEALLIDVSEISGFASPGVGARHWLMTELASVGRGWVRAAFLIRPEFVDPEHFGTTVARSHGFHVKGFHDQASALAWLRNPG